MVDDVTTFWTALSAVGALGVGGVAGSWWAHHLRERAGQKREKRERIGLLRLLRAEIELNTTLLEAQGHAGEDKESAQVASRYLSFTKTQVWRATRVRAAQLVPEDLLKS